MAFVSSSFSNRKLQGRRFTLATVSDSVEAFTSTIDTQGFEVLTDDRYIPTGSAGNEQIPFSGSSQHGYYYTTGSTIETTAGNYDVLRYYYRHKLTRGSDGSGEVYFFQSGEPGSATDTPGNNQVISSSQQTNFISNKNAAGSLGAGDAENSAGLGVAYNAVIYSSTDADKANLTVDDKIDPANYVFDYKTGVLTFTPGNEVAGSNYVYITVNQYVGRTLKSQLNDGSLGGSSGVSSFNDLTDVPSGLLSSSAQIASDISGSLGSNATLIRSLTAAGISGSFTEASSSFSTRVTTLEGNEVHTAAAISGSTRFTIAGQDDSFTVGQDDTINFISGSAGITVLSDSTDTITIGASTDDVTFNSVTADTLTGTASFANKVVLSEASNNADRPIIVSIPTSPTGQIGTNTGNYGLKFNTQGGILKITDLLDASFSPSALNTDSTTFSLVNSNVTTLNVGGAASTINMGAANGTVNIAGSASIAGDLTVQGTVTSIQTENLNVSDQFILLASGSTGTTDGGIIIQSGSNGVGTALYFDANANRWAVNPANSVNWNDTSLTPKQYVVSVSASAAAPPTDPLDFGNTNEYYGMMHVNTDNGDIYIYS